MHIGAHFCFAAGFLGESLQSEATPEPEIRNPRWLALLHHERGERGGPAKIDFVGLMTASNLAVIYKALPFSFPTCCLACGTLHARKGRSLLCAPDERCRTRAGRGKSAPPFFGLTSCPIAFWFLGILLIAAFFLSHPSCWGSHYLFAR